MTSSWWNGDNHQEVTRGPDRRESRRRPGQAQSTSALTRLPGMVYVTNSEDNTVKVVDGNQQHSL